jgi:membrane-associated protease RseP (regulator of RpoE activity)
MSEHRLSFWQVLGLLALVLTLCAVSLAGGVFLGYQWGRANGMALALRERASSQTETPRFTIPFLPEPNQPSDRPANQPYLGVRFEMITPELAEAEKLEVEEGAILREVTPGSPADKAGLKAGDIVQAVDGEAVNADHTLRDRIMAHQPGDEVTLKILREGETLEVKATLGTRPASLPFARGEFPLTPGFHFEFRCSPEPCPFPPFFNEQPKQEPTY